MHRAFTNGCVIKMQQQQHPGPWSMASLSSMLKTKESSARSSLLIAIFNTLAGLQTYQNTSLVILLVKLCKSSNTNMLFHRIPHYRWSTTRKSSRDTNTTTANQDYCEHHGSFRPYPFISRSLADLAPSPSGKRWHQAAEEDDLASGIRLRSQNYKRLDYRSMFT